MSRVYNNHLKTWARRLFAALLGVVFLIAFAELLLRVFLFQEWKSLSASLLVGHPVYGHFNKPNAKVRRYKPQNYDVINSTNSMGFRDREASLKADLAGIWLAGGSNSFGAGLEDDQLYSMVLERFGYRALNLSSQGHRPPQQVRLIRDLARKGFRPRAVLFEFTMNSTNFEVVSKPDAMDSINAPLPGITNAAGGAVINSEQPFAILSANARHLAAMALPSFIGAKARLIRHSAIYGWLKVGLNNIPFVRQKLLDWQLTRHVDFKGALTPEMYVEGPNNQGDARIEKAADYFAEFQSWVKTNLKVPFAVLVVPGHHEIYVDRFRHWREHAGLTHMEMDPFRPRKRFMRALRARGVSVLDPLPALNAQAPKPLIFPDDGHLNSTGHGTLAGVAKSWLENAGVVMGSQ
jgi:hypothetical protein